MMTEVNVWGKNGPNASNINSNERGLLWSATRGAHEGLYMVVC